MTCYVKKCSCESAEKLGLSGIAGVLEQEVTLYENCDEVGDIYQINRGPEPSKKIYSCALGIKCDVPAGYN